MAIPVFFQRFLKIPVQEITKLTNFENEVIWRTAICEKLFEIAAR
jgi:hypothetical protein